MLRGLPVNITETDVCAKKSGLKMFSKCVFLIILLRFNQFSVFISLAQIRASIEQLEGPQPMDVRLMKKRTGEPWRTVDFSSAKPVTTGPTCFCPNAFCHSNSF